MTLMDEPMSQMGLREYIDELQSQGYDTYDADEVLGFDADQRRFAFAAVMLQKLGVSAVRVLTNNPEKIAALKKAGLDVVSDHRVLGARPPRMSAI